MSDENLSPLLALSDSSPQQAAQNIQGAKYFDITPDAVKSMNMLPQMEADKKPAAIPQVAQFASQSPEHAKLIEPDIEKLNLAGDMWKLHNDIRNGQNINRRLNNYYLKKMNGEPTTPEEDFQRLDDEVVADEIDARHEAYKVPFVATIPSEVAAMAEDLARAAIQQSPIIAATTAAAAIPGAIAGGLIGGIAGMGGGAIPGAIAGGTFFGGYGLSTGVLLATGVDSYQQTAGAIYRDLSKMQKPQPATVAIGGELGAPPEPLNIPEETKANLARGAGILVGIINTAAFSKIKNGVGFFKQLGEKTEKTAAKATITGVAEVLMRPENAAWRETLITLGKAIGTSAYHGGLAGAQSDVIINAAEKIGATYDGSEVSVQNGLWNLTGDIDTLARMTRAATIGAAGGAGIHAGLEVVGKVGEGAGAVARKILPKKEKPTPEVRTDIPGEKHLIEVQDQHAIMMSIAMEHDQAIHNKVEMKTTAPEEHRQVRAENLPGELWTMSEDLRKWIGDDQKRSDAVNKAIGSAGLEALDRNAPVRFAGIDAAELGDIDKSFHKIIRETPASPSAAEAVARVKSVQEKRAALLEGAPKAAEAPKDNVDSLTLRKETEKLDRLRQRVAGFEEPGAIEDFISKKWNRADELRELEQEAADPKTFPLEKKKLIERIEELRDIADDNFSDHLHDLETKIVLQEMKIKVIGDKLKKSPSVSEFIEPKDPYTDPTLDQVLEGVTEKEGKKIADGLRETRNEVIEATHLENLETGAPIDLEQRVSARLESKKLIDQIEKNDDIKVVENFIGSKQPGELSAGQKFIQTKGLPADVINPASLDPIDRAKFADDPVLKHRKVFDKGGSDADSIAHKYGFRNAADLLDILSTVPTREEAIRQAGAQVESSIRVEAGFEINFKDSKIARAYEKLGNRAHKIYEALKSKTTSGKDGVVRHIDIPLKSIEEIKNSARERIGALKVGELRPDQWKIGERASLRNVVEALRAGGSERAFSEAGKWLENVFNARQAHISFSEVDRNLKWVSEWTKPEFQAELKSLGIQDAFTNILDVFKFDRTLEGQSKENAFDKAANEVLAGAQGDPRIDPEVIGINDKSSYRELTVDQLNHVIGKARELYTAENSKQTMSWNDQLANREAATSVIAGGLADNLRNTNKSYDAEKANRPQTERPSKSEKWKRWLRLGGNSVANLKFKLLELDQENLNGQFQRTIGNMMMGVGEFAKLKMGQRYAVELTAKAKKEFYKHVKTYDEKEFRSLGQQTVNVPEFKVAEGLSKGAVTKLDLLVMLMHMGTAENRKALENFGVSSDTIMTVLRRELTKKEFDLVQNGVWNIFKSYKSDIARLDLKTKGIVTEFVDPLSFEEFGQKYEGGYMPLNYVKDVTAETVRIAESKKFDNLTEGKQIVQEPFAFQGIVKDSHLIKRVGSQFQVSLSPHTLSMGFENIIHDLAYREPVADSMKLLQDKNLAEAIQGTIGPEGYRLMTNSIAEMTRSSAVEEISLYQDQHAHVSNIFRGLESAAAIGHIAFNVGSMRIQLMAMNNVLQKMGVQNGSKHVSFVLLRMMKDFRHLNDVFREAAEIDPNLQLHASQLDSYAATNLGKEMPKGYGEYNLRTRVQEMYSKVGFDYILGNIDMAQRMVSILAAKRQFLSGEAAGWSIEKLSKISEEKRIELADGYAVQISDTSHTTGGQIDRAAIQKFGMTRGFTRYWNDGRASLNSRLSDQRKFRNNVRDGIQSAKDGDFSAAYGAFNTAGDIGMRVAMMGMATMFLTQWARGRSLNGDPDKGFWETLDSTPQWIDDHMSLSGAAALADEVVVQHIPIFRDMAYAAKYARRGQADNIATPMIQALTQMTTSGLATFNVMSEILSGTDLIGAYDSLTPQQIQALVSTTSIFTGGFPVQAGTKAFNYFDRKQYETDPFAQFAGWMLSPMMKKNDDFIKKHDETPEQMIDRLIEETGKSQLQQVVDVAKTAQAVLTGQDKVLPVDEVLNKFYGIESTAGKNLTSNKTSVYGPFHFLKSTWDLAVKLAPEDLKLTEEGWKDKYDADMHWRAAKFLVGRYTGLLKEGGYPATPENLYTMWVFGESGGYDIVSAGPFEKMRNIVSGEARKNNQAEDYETVGEFRDEWPAKRLAIGQKNYEDSISGVLKPKTKKSKKR